jgi:glycosyltransferase involved in cell wall biosynthesis
VVVRGIRQVLTILDLFPLIFPRNYRQQHYYFRYYLPRVLKRSQRIIAISTNTGEDMKKYFPGVPPCEVVLLGLRNDLVKLKSTPVESLVDKPFYLFVGPNFKYKNADRLIEAFASIVPDERFAGHQLVFTGGRSDYIDFLKNLIDTRFRSITNQVHFLGYVAASELAWLYQHARATTITTLYEGFGLPALEAMHFGCPVIASDVASLPEVCGDAALMVDPYQVDQIAAAMKQVTVDDELRRDLVARGHLNLTRFSWQKAAEQVGAVLKEVANQPAKQV